ncbi:MAG: hypothetical protein D6769_00535 [Methanobacteriota archaeon]|nr:MAG: hypothetical protein D6769_00535 [Euryarchaeota archaeon]
MLEGDKEKLFDEVRAREAMAIESIHSSFQKRLNSFMKMEESNYNRKRKALSSFYKRRLVHLSSFMRAEENFDTAYARYESILSAFNKAWAELEVSVKRNPKNYVRWALSETLREIRVRRVSASPVFIKTLKSRGFSSIYAAKIDGTLKFFGKDQYMDFSFPVVKQLFRHIMLQEVASKWVK